VAERDDEHQEDKGRRLEAAPAIVEAQVEIARAGVFRAYVRAREKARRLAEEDLDGPGDRHRRAS
jgi:hypothetical protein